MEKLHSIAGDVIKTAQGTIKDQIHFTHKSCVILVLYIYNILYFQ